MRIRSNWNSYKLTSIGNVKDTMENNFKVSQKGKHISITRLTNRYLLKKNEGRCLHKVSYGNVRSCFCFNSHKLETTPVPINNEWVSKLCGTNMQSNSGRWCNTGEPAGCSPRSGRVGHGWVTELNWRIQWNTVNNN